MREIKYKWVVGTGYDTDEYETESEAIAAAEKAIQDEDDYARDNDGYSEDCEGIWVAKLTYASRLFPINPPDDDDVDDADISDDEPESYPKPEKHDNYFTLNLIKVED